MPGSTAWFSSAGPHRSDIRATPITPPVIPPGRRRDHGWLDVGDAADSDGLGETVDGDELGVDEVVGVGERLMRGI